MAMDVEPIEWTQVPRPLNKEQLAELSSEELEDRSDRIKLARVWLKHKTHAVPHILNLIGESSMARIKSKYNDAFRDACVEDDIMKILRIIKASHTFMDKSSTLKDRTHIESVLCNFQSEGEEQSVYLKRWHVVARLAARLGSEKPPGEMQYLFVKGMLKKCPAAVESLVIKEIARLNALPREALKVAADFSVDDFSDRVSAILSASDYEWKADADPKPLALLASSGSIASKLKAKGATAGSSETSAVCTDSERIILSKIKKGMSRKEAIADLICNCCGGAGHIKKDCPDDEAGPKCCPSVSSDKSQAVKARKGITEATATTMAAYREDEQDVDEDWGKVFVFQSCASIGVELDIDDICGHVPDTSAATLEQKIESCETSVGMCSVAHMCPVVDDANDVFVGHVAPEMFAAAAELEHVVNTYAVTVASSGCATWANSSSGTALVQNSVV